MSTTTDKPPTIEEIRERRRIWYTNEGQLTRDIDFLLAEVDRLSKLVTKALAETV